MSVVRMRSLNVQDQPWPANRLVSTRFRIENVRLRRLVRHAPPTWAVACVASLIMVTALAQAAFPAARVTLFTPELVGGSGLVSALIWLFSAFVLVLFPIEEYRNRLRWLALVCVLLGVAAMLFDVVVPIVSDYHGLTTSMYLSIGAQTMAMAVLCIGFVPAVSPRLDRRVVIGTVLSLGIILLIAVTGVSGLPQFTSLATWDAPIAEGVTVQNTLSAVPLGFGLLACLGFVRNRPSSGWPWWLSMAMLFLVGSEIHNIVVPSGFSPAFTSSRLLSVCWASRIAIGGVIQMHRVALERHQLLVAERAHSQRLNHLASLKADFTSMVAHELGGPIAAVRSLATIADFDDFGREDRSRALRDIQLEAKLLGTLVRDVQSVCEMERDEFAVSLRPFSADTLRDDAVRYARARFAGERTFIVEGGGNAQVLADP